MSTTALTLAPTAVRQGLVHCDPEVGTTEELGTAAVTGRGHRWDEAGATTAEYATVTGVGVGFAAVLFKFLTSEMGQELLRMIFTAIRSLLPF